MRKSIIILIPLFIIATATACSDLFNRGDDGPQLRIQTTKSATQTTTFNGDTLVFTPYVPTDSLPPRDYPPFTNDVKDDQIVINGYYLSSGTWQPKASINKNDNIITITLERPDMDGSNYGPVGYFYNAYINGLNNSQYTVEIIHQRDMMRGIDDDRHTVFSKEITVRSYG